MWSAGAEWPKGSLAARLSSETRSKLLAMGRWREFSAGNHLIVQGQVRDEVFLLTDGVVKIVAETEEGGPTMLAVRVRGDVVGELAAVDRQPRAATVTAAGVVRARLLSGREFQAFMAANSDAAMALNASTREKLRFANRRRVDYGRYEVAIRLARLLLDLSERHGVESTNGLRVGVALSQPELASLIGASEPAVSRALREMRLQGMILTEYRHQVLVDIKSLQAAAGPPSGGKV